MKSVRNTGLLSAALFLAAIVFATFTMSDSSLVALSAGLLGVLLCLRSMDARRARQLQDANRGVTAARKEAAQILKELAAQRTSLEAVVGDLAAQRKSLGLVYREVRAGNIAFTDADTLSCEQGERQLAIALRALSAAKREIEEKIDVAPGSPEEGQASES